MSGAGGLEGLPFLVVHGGVVGAAVGVLVPSLLAWRGYRAAERDAQRAKEDLYAGLGPACRDPAGAPSGAPVALSGVLEGPPRGVSVMSSRLDAHRLCVRCGAVSVELDGPVSVWSAGVEAWADGRLLDALSKGDRVLVRGIVHRKTSPASEASAYRTAGEGFAVVPAEGEGTIVVAYDGPARATPRSKVSGAVVGATIGAALLGVVSAVGWASSSAVRPGQCRVGETSGIALAAATPARERALITLAQRAAAPECAGPGAEQRAEALETLAGRSCAVDLQQVRGLPFGDPLRAARYFDRCPNRAELTAGYLYRAGSLRAAARRFARERGAGGGSFARHSTGAATMHLLVEDYEAADQALSGLITVAEAPATNVTGALVADTLLPSSLISPERESERPMVPFESPRERRVRALRDVREYVLRRLRGQTYGPGDGPVSRVLAAGAGEARLDPHHFPPGLGESLPVDRALRNVWRALLAARGPEAPRPPVLLELSFVDLRAALRLWKSPSRVENSGLYVLERAAHERLASEPALSPGWSRVRANFALRAALGASARGSHDEAIGLCAGALRDLRAAPPPLPLDVVDGEPWGPGHYENAWVGARFVQAVVHMRALRLPPAEGERPAVGSWAAELVGPLDSIERVRTTGVFDELEFPMGTSPHVDESSPMSVELSVLLEGGYDDVVRVLHQHTIVAPQTGRVVLRNAHRGLLRSSVRDSYDPPDEALLPSPSAYLHALVEYDTLHALIGRGDEARPRPSRDELLASTARSRDAVAVAILEALEASDDTE